jgi:hypothetical protein
MHTECFQKILPKVFLILINNNKNIREGERELKYTGSVLKNPNTQLHK